VTQFVVGGAGESDLELLSTTERLYRQFHVRRAYYSPFSPVIDTPLEDLPAESALREQRLYQASFLLRDYGFAMEELPFNSSGFLPAELDPKQAWARENLAGKPVELNRATREELLRIPGIGPKAAQAIVATRRRNPLKEVSDLRRLGIRTSRSLPYILLDGRQPGHQLTMF
jgi:predicted DNA-binding helix-hairpin-helix protein